MPTRVVRDDDEQQIADLIRLERRLRARLATTNVRGGHDLFTVAATPLTDYPLSVIPVSGTCEVTLNGDELEEGSDYTVDYDLGSATAGVVTVSAGLSVGDVLTARYLQTDWLVARSLPEETDTLPQWLDREGWHASSSPSGWAMASPMTIGKRTAGTWHYSSVACPNLLGLGLADAYSVETVVTAKPTGSVFADPFYYCDWYCGFIESGPTTGVYLETDNSTATLYLARSGSIVLSSSHLEVPAGTTWTPQVGDDIQVIVDFTAATATVYVNGTAATHGSLNFAAETWYTADGSLV